MAEKGSSVDSIEIKLSDVCEEGGNKVNATNYCLQCEQYLCLDCRNYHTRVKGTRSHELSGTDKIPKVTSATNISESTEAYICKEHERKLDYFCKTHKVELCLACKRIEHKECSTVVAIRQAAQEIFSTNHGIKILKSLKDLTDGFADCKAAAKTIKDKLPEKKARAVESVKHARKVADQYLDKIEADAFHELDIIYEAETTSLEEKIHICAASESFLQKRVNSLEKSMSIGEPEKEFIETNKATKETKQYCITLQELYEEVFEKQLTFQHNSNLITLDEWLNDLGKCCQEKSSDATTFHGPIAIYSREMKVKTETDTDEPRISSYNELPDGRKLLVDWKNKKVKMFDDQNIFISELILTDGIPWNLVLLGSTEAVVSSLNNKLHYISISDVISPIFTKDCEFKVFAMHEYGKEILAVLEIYNKNLRLAVLRKGGDRKTTVFSFKAGLLSRPWFLACSADQEIVHILDVDKGYIGYSLKDMQVLLQYHDKEVKLYNGLAAGGDCLFIGTESQDGNVTEIRRLPFSGAVERLNFCNLHPLQILGKEIALTSAITGDNVLDFCYFLR